MTRQAIIEKTINAINQLPEHKAEEISDFADFMIKKFADNRLTESIQNYVSKSKTFDFLYDEEDIYLPSDLKEKFND